MQTEELIRELPKGLIKWYKFHTGGRALYVASGIEADKSLSEALEERGLSVDVMDIAALEGAVSRQMKSTGVLYDYIIIVGALERSKNPEKVLCTLKSMLGQTGTLLLGADNRLGIRYFCGDRDVFTERNFDSVENYVRINMSDREQLGGRAYARAELIQMLEGAGFTEHRFYSVLPGLERPQILYAEDYLPEEELEDRIFPQYHYPDTVFLEEQRLYTTLIQNGLFHIMANGYLVECPLDGNFANARQVTISMERGRENAMSTVIRRDGKVEKSPVYTQGLKKLDCLMENTLDLRRHGVKMIDIVREENAIVMPCVRSESVTDYFRKLLCRDKELFLQELDCFWTIILHSSEHVPYETINWEQFEPDWQNQKADDPNRVNWRKIAFGTKYERENLGIILRKGYLDLVSCNCFLIDGDFVFCDQEFYVENLPAKAILQRTIVSVYRGNTQLEMILPMKQVQERYRLLEYSQLWDQFTWHFFYVLRNDAALYQYHNMYRPDTGVVHSNRQRMNYSSDEYERIFRNIFRGTEGRKIYLFGSGNFTKKFLSQFGAEYEIAGIIDNKPDKWGTELSGIKVYAPDHLRSLAIGSYKVIVCIKNFVPVIKQLKELGVRDYGIFDSNMKYPREIKRVASQDTDRQDAPKKYHVGYIAGVFDLYHIGHLNMFKRAKELCDYLIVGVVNDECVMKNKKTMPYVPFEERIELVRTCRYVDEAVEIPTEYSDTDEAYRRYQFDVQFSGSDYAQDPAWLSKQVFLQKQGSDMVFFPYTQSTSSTKLKGLIEKGLI